MKKALLFSDGDIDWVNKTSFHLKPTAKAKRNSGAKMRALCQVLGGALWLGH